MRGAGRSWIWRVEISLLDTPYGIDIAEIKVVVYLTTAEIRQFAIRQQLVSQRRTKWLNLSGQCDNQTVKIP